MFYGICLPCLLLKLPLNEEVLLVYSGSCVIGLMLIALVAVKAVSFLDFQLRFDSLFDAKVAIIAALQVDSCEDKLTVLHVYFWDVYFLSECYILCEV